MFMKHVSTSVSYKFVIDLGTVKDLPECAPSLVVGSGPVKGLQLADKKLPHTALGPR
jgi:hypothetical protein